MHPEHADPVVRRIAAGGLLFVNSTVFDEMPITDGATVVAIPATELAVDAGNVMAASIVMVGAYVAVTTLVGLDSLVEAVTASLPPYRKQHIALNERALRVGHDAAPELAVPAR